jgi:hypothetical protein
LREVDVDDCRTLVGDSMESQAEADDARKRIEAVAIVCEWLWDMDEVSKMLLQDLGLW